IFTLVDQEGRLFKPLAYTKNLAMAIAALLAITLDPAMRMMFTRMDRMRFRPRWLAWISHQIVVGTYYPEEKHPISRVLFTIYEPVCRFVLRWPKTIVLVALLLLASTVPVYLRLGSEFFPPLDEGTLLYMPTSLPGVSVTEATRLLQTMDRLIEEVPEVVSVWGKAGRAETSTDPAPFSMMETTIVLKPRFEWRSVHRFYSDLPESLQKPFRHIWSDRISKDDIVNELDQKLQFPGVTNAWTMPIKARIDMLTTGVRTPIGIKIFGPDLTVIENIGAEVERTVREVPGTRSIYAERTAGGYFLDFDLKREALARYGLSVQEAQDVIMSAIGGETVTRTVEGRERYTVNVRYARELRDDLESLKRVLVPTMSGAQIPLAQLADIHFTTGPSMIRDENGMLSGYVYVDISGSDIGGYVEKAKAAVARSVKLPTGYTVQWSGQYENMLRVRERLQFVVPITIFVIFILLYMNTKSPVKATIVMLAVPFSVIGAVWLVYWLGYNVSIATWVGMIALMGLDAETGVFMLLFLDLSYYDAVRAGKMRTRDDLREAIIHGAVKRIRPKMMTVAAAFMGLMPIMGSLGTGADMMKRVVAPMVGGLVTSFVLELLIYPPIYEIWKWRFEMKQGRVDPSEIPLPARSGT
ncbi:MAG: efflux RND transporter permease subunit, partial [Acidobacteriia bacterium]|nr:efflux RND transporter permease subunit [Terriglobia bacterium]